MKRKRLWVGACLIVAMFSGAGNSFALTLNYSSVTGANISFDGTNDQFTFPNTGKYDFQITGGDGAGAINLYGNLDGTFTIGTITTTNLPSSVLEQALVSGSGTITIYDGYNNLNATIQWKDIYTFSTQGISSGSLNTAASGNITNIQYGGSNSTLILLKNYQSATGNLSFQFVNPGISLTELTKNGTTHTTSYSGSISAIPVPPTALLLGSGLVGVFMVYRRRRQSRGF
jgi:hypothetical protein